MQGWPRWMLTELADYYLCGRTVINKT